MDDNDEFALSVDEFVEYCRTQAGLLSGRVETMGAKANELLDEIDEETAAVRTRLDAQRSDISGTKAPQSTDRPDGAAVDIRAIAELESEIEKKQTLVEAKRVRMQAFQEVAANYTDLAEELQSDVDNGREAMNRVVRFEVDHNAPVYFEDRQTVSEAAVASRESDTEPRSS
jgi:hypothetical protein